ncbi:MAG: helix-turn-helix transcriptional regulator, partial [Clostridia bacterium]|nr:helix-turn-helix transcriptional regulator [Clostridia bacterium]
RAARRAAPDYLSCDCCLLLILQAIKQTKTAVPAQQKLYDDVCAYIGKHAREDPSAAKVADALGYHKDYVCRVVKKCGGRTLGQLIAAERIGIAKGLLGSTGYPLEKIAAALNFSSANSFVKFFKYHVSMTPSEYRKKR